MKNNKVLVVMFFLMLIIIAGELIVYSNYSSFTGKKKHITYIAYGESADEWSVLKEGATSFLKKDEGDITLFSSSIVDGAQGQIALMEEALASNCDAIVVAPINSIEIDEYVNSINPKKPIIMLCSGQNMNQVYHLYPSDEEIGHTLAAHVLDDKKKTLLVVSYGRSESLSRRLQAMESDFASESIICKEFCAEDNDYDYSRLGFYLSSKAFDGVVALDKLSMSKVIDFARNTEVTADIYGVSNSKQAVHGLDHGVVKNLIYIDEFSLGYVSAALSLDSRMSDSELLDTIKYYDVNKENMYEDKLSRVLFPFDN